MTDSLSERFAEERLTEQREFVEDLRLALIKGTHGCELQEGTDGKPWPCGTCTCGLLAGLIPDSAAEYSQHNHPVDRVNEVWRAILQIRDFTGRP
jgi:hypothetical protein